MKTPLDYHTKYSIIYQFIFDSLEMEIKSNQLYGLGGFCNRISKILETLDIHYIDPYDIEDFKFFFPELYKYKPEKTYGPFWFKLEDHENRLNIIKKVLSI